MEELKKEQCKVTSSTEYRNKYLETIDGEIIDIRHDVKDMHDLFNTPTLINRTDEEQDKAAGEEASAFTNEFKNAMRDTMESITGEITRKE